LSCIPAERRPEVRHQCGAKHVEATRAAYACVDVEANVEAFIGDMASAYAWADFVICRAGALTLAELAAAGLGSILMPFPHAVDDHQTKNAEAFVAAGAAKLVQDRDFEAPLFAGLLGRVLHDPDQRLSMANAARAGEARRRRRDRPTLPGGGRMTPHRLPPHGDIMQGFRRVHFIGIGGAGM